MVTPRAAASISLRARTIIGSDSQRQRYFDHEQLSRRHRGAPERDSGAHKEAFN
jgi:hypothetical protein